MLHKRQFFVIKFLTLHEYPCFHSREEVYEDDGFLNFHINPILLLVYVTNGSEAFETPLEIHLFSILSESFIQFNVDLDFVPSAGHKRWSWFEFSGK